MASQYDSSSNALTKLDSYGLEKSCISSSYTLMKNSLATQNPITLINPISHEWDISRHGEDEIVVHLPWFIFHGSSSKLHTSLSKFI